MKSPRSIQYKKGDIVYFWPMSGRENAKVKVTGFEGEDNVLVEFLEPFSNRLLDKKVGETHNPSRENLVPIP